MSSALFLEYRKANDISRSEHTRHLVLALFWLLGGTFLTASFYIRLIPPLTATISFAFVIFLFGIVVAKSSELSLLPRFYALLYFMPFSATLGYLFDENYIFWGSPAAFPLSSDHVVVNLMVMIGLVGLFGLFGGYEISSFLFKRASKSVSLSQQSQHVKSPVLGMVSFLSLASIALFLSWLSAPKNTVLSAAYASASAGSSVAQQTNFNAAFLVAYVLLVMLYIDGERSAESCRKGHWKVYFTLAITFFAVIYFQVLRGDRDSIGLIIALASLYITKQQIFSTNFQRYKSKHGGKRRVFFGLGVVILLFIAVGSWRFRANEIDLMSSSDLYDTFLNGLQQNTWTSVALNNLGLAAEYDSNVITYFNGQTYVDYFLSLPPGPIARAIGYVRPLETTSGPNWWYAGLSTGGMQPAIVPFKNFGIFGTFFILILIGIFISKIECDAQKETFYSRLYYGAMFVVSFKWFWYGDMNIIRCLMITSLLALLYRAFVDGTLWKSPDSRPTNIKLARQHQNLYA